MYEQFYGLSRTPFAVTPDPLMLFMSRIHREALATIIYGVETRKGFIVCTGEVGTGKSTIVRAFFDQAGADAVKLIYIFTPQVMPFEMARFICDELGLDQPESVFAAVPRLQLKLLEIFESGKTVVLMIDEAQLLPPETLEFLRLLSNFETDTEKLIQIVLVGQPEVDTMLARRDMRQVAQRVALRARLGPFDIEESYEYIEHRLRVAGASEMTQVMSPSAGWLIAEAAGGIPRRINILADNALIAGFGAAQRPLGSQLAGIAVRDFLAKSGAARPPPPKSAGAGWRGAFRLRGALAREREEPAEFRPVSLPRPEPAVTAASAPSMPPTPGPPPSPAARAAQSPEALSVGAAAPAEAEPVPLPAEDPKPRQPDEGLGEPVSAADIAVVAPLATATLEPRTIGFEATTAPPPPDEPSAPRQPAAIPVAAPRPPLPRRKTAFPPAAAVVAARPAQWPALSRVRLQMPLQNRTPQRLAGED